MARNGGKPIELPPNILKQLPDELGNEALSTGNISRKSKLGMLKSKGPRS